LFMEVSERISLKFITRCGIQLGMCKTDKGNCPGMG